MSKNIASLGLILDILGVWSLAYEILKPFRGRRDQLRVAAPFDQSGGSSAPTAYDLWERMKGKYGIAGLILLTLGFVLQLVSIWLQ